MGNRQEYLDDGSNLTRVEHDASRTIPDYLLREAAAEEPWEEREKALLEISSWARQFRSKFLEAYKVENRQTVQVWEADKAASWLKDKVIDKEGRFDRNKASEILAAAQCLDEKRTEVMRLLGAEESEGKRETGSPTLNLEDVNPPRTAKEVSDADNEHKMEELRKRKAVGAYGILLSESTCQLYKQGAKLAEVYTEDFGGYSVLASEIDSMSDPKEVEAFFDLHDDADAVSKIGWLSSKAAPTYDDPTYQHDDALAGDTNVFQKEEVPQAAPGRTDPLSEGPASLEQGADAKAPAIPGQDGK